MATTPFITDAQATQKVQESHQILDTKLDSITTGVKVISGVTTTTATPAIGLGNVQATVGPGTYPNWGGMVIPDNNQGTLQRIDGVFSVTLVPVVLGNYALKSELPVRIMALPVNTYHTPTSARTDVPTNERFLGLTITYTTALGVWVTEKFIGSDVSSWLDKNSWSNTAKKIDQLLKPTVNLFDNTITPELISGNNTFKIINVTAGDIIRLSVIPAVLREFSSTGVKIQSLNTTATITTQQTGSYIMMYFSVAVDTTKLVVTKNQALPADFVEHLNVDTRYIKGYKDVQTSSDFVNNSLVVNNDNFSNKITIDELYNNSGNLQTLGSGYLRTDFIDLKIDTLKSLEYYLRQGISAPGIIFFDDSKSLIASSIIPVTQLTYISGSFSKAELLALYPTARYVIIQTNNAANAYIKIKNYEVTVKDYVVKSTSTSLIAGEFNEKPATFLDFATGTYAYANNTYKTKYSSKLKRINVETRVSGTISIYSIDFDNPTNNILLKSGIDVSAGVNDIDLSSFNLSVLPNRYIVIKGSSANLFKSWKTNSPYKLLTYNSSLNSAYFNETANRVAYSVTYDYDQVSLNFTDDFKFSLDKTVAEFQAKNSSVYNIKTPLNTTSDLYYKRGARLGIDSEYTPLLLVMGQSNTDGRAPNTSIPSDVVDGDGKLSKFKMWNFNTNTFSDYQLGLNVGSNNVDGTTPNNYKAFGYDVFFAKKYLEDNPSKTLYCVKTSKGATGIYNTGEWNPLTGIQTDNYVNRIFEALKWGKENNIKFIPICILYHQGEWDADQGSAGVSAYKQNVSNLFAFFRGFLSSPNIPILNGQCSYTYAGGSYVPINNIFSELNTLDFYFKTVNMANNQTFIDASLDTLGNIHYDASALKFMGEDMYTKFKSYNL